MIKICVMTAIQLYEGNHLSEAFLKDQLFTNAIQGSFQFEESYFSIEESY